MNRELAELFERLGRSRETLQALNRAHACFTQLRARHELADVGRRMARLEGDFLDVVRQWGESIESKDVHTQGHCERVADLAGALAAKVGLRRIVAVLVPHRRAAARRRQADRAGRGAEQAGRAHRRRSGRSSASIPAAGVELLAEVEFPWDVTPMVRSHHERWDGQGYPDGLAGEAIPLAARILCIADVYDALTTQRSYKRPFSHLEAMEIMRRAVGAAVRPAAVREVRGAGASRRAQPAARRPSVRAPRAAPAPMNVVRLGGGRSHGRARAARVHQRDDGGARRAAPDGRDGVAPRDRRRSVQVGERQLRPSHGRRRAAHRGRRAARAAAAGPVRGPLRGRRVRRAAAGAGRRRGARARRQGARSRRARWRSRCASRRREQTMHVTLSIGVATAPQHGESFETLFTAADRALFDAKRDGRDKVVLAGAEVGGPAAARASRDSSAARRRCARSSPRSTRACRASRRSTS